MGVWIETADIHIDRPDTVSHPAWVCGLKQNAALPFVPKGKSHPAWVCGLKRDTMGVIPNPSGHTLRGCVDWNNDVEIKFSGNVCHTLRGCVDWNNDDVCDRAVIYVTPCVGVWIETLKHTKQIQSKK